MELTFMSVISWNSFKRPYMVNLLDRYFSLRKAKLFAGPSEITPNTKSRSMKYSLILGISNAGFLSSAAVISR